MPKATPEQEAWTQGYDACRQNVGVQRLPELIERIDQMVEVGMIDDRAADHLNKCIRNIFSDLGFPFAGPERITDGLPNPTVSLTDCIASGKHLTSCDNDGYCNFCGEQATDADFTAEDEEPEHDEEWDDPTTWSVSDPELPRGTHVRVGGSGCAHWVLTVGTDEVYVRMVGDNRDYTVDRDEVTVIDRDEFCGQCGQVGCTHDGLDREDG